MITYTEVDLPKIGLAVRVSLDRKIIGTIYRVVGGWQYQPNSGSKENRLSAEIFPTILKVKQSLESDE